MEKEVYQEMREGMCNFFINIKESQRDVELFFAKAEL